MIDLGSLFSIPNVRSIWKALRDSGVPIVTADDIRNIDERVDLLVRGLRENSYLPSIGHGYLGYPKKNGCTRFVPILTKEDMAVYFTLVLSLQSRILNNVPGVYGGWRSVPKAVLIPEDKEEDESAIYDPYFSASISKDQWFKNWTNFSDLLLESASQKNLGNYVITTDIANFYDTIDLNHLHARLHSAAPGADEVIAYLKMFLGSCDRRVKGYTVSSKGIPQEIISDASRTLANFYLKEFDERFKEYCDHGSLVYVRWADDIIVFGPSPKQLELAVHRASRLLLALGLNLNAAKTKIFSRNDFFMHRGLGVLDAIHRSDVSQFLTELRRFERFAQRADARVDTVYRASVGFLFREPKARTPFTTHFLYERSSHFDHLGSLNARQMCDKISLGPVPSKQFDDALNLITRYPYAWPRASFLQMIGKYKIRLISAGISKAKLEGAVAKIERLDGGSALIHEFCIPATRRKL